MDDVMRALYAIVQERKKVFAEGSYTCYLFAQGLDKILKKCGEECSETIIAAKTLEARAALEARESREVAARRGANGEDGAIAPVVAPAASAAPDAASVAEARADVENEICDLIYHITVLLAQLEIPLENIENILRARSAKIGNLKQMKVADRNS